MSHMGGAARAEGGADVFSRLGTIHARIAWVADSVCGMLHGGRDVSGSDEG